MATPAMFREAAAFLLAVALYPLVLIGPGYAIAQRSNVLAFRGRQPLARLAIALLLSMATVPIAVHLLGRLAGLDGASVAIVVPSAWLTLRAVRRFRPFTFARSGALVAAGLAASAWTVLAMAMVIDIHLPGRIYVSVVSYDYAARVAITAAIHRTGIPPDNPMFFPGAPVDLHYYYLWPALCSLVDRLGGPLVDARAAAQAGTVWAGFALAAIVALASDTFVPSRSVSVRLRTGVALGLLAVSGLDILPSWPSIAGLFTSSGPQPINATIDWWNVQGQITGWFDSVVWVPQHIAALTACFTGTVLLRTPPAGRSRRERFVPAALAGCAFASAAGLSLWVTLAFAIGLAAWFAVALARRWWDEVRGLALAAAVAALLATPFLLELLQSGHGEPQPLRIGVRPFSPVAQALAGLPWSQQQIWYLAVLPINYGLELGFFGLAGMAYWVQRRRSGEPVTRNDGFLLVMLTSSLAACTFVRSSIFNNDFGWRGMLVVQLVLLLWSVEPLIALARAARQSLERGLRPGPNVAAARGERFTLVTSPLLLGICLLLGLITTAYEGMMLRLVPFLAEQGTVAVPLWLSPDNEVGRRTYALRQAYDWAAAVFPEDAIIQHDPRVAMDIGHSLYGRRQVVIADRTNGPIYGSDRQQFEATYADLETIFDPLSPLDAASLTATCHKLGITALLVKDSDPLWQAPGAWPHRLAPRYDNGMVRIYDCLTVTPVDLITSN